MRTKAELSHIKERLDALERTSDPSTINRSLESAQAAIVDLRAAQDVSETMLERLTAQNAEMRHVIAEGIERTERTERRIRASVQRAKKELEKRGLTDPAVDAEDYELQLFDGKDGKPAEVPPVQPRVEDPLDRPSSVPGVTVGEILRHRGVV